MNETNYTELIDNLLPAFIETLGIVTNVLLPGAFSGMIRGLTVLAVTLVGYSAMAGIVGGGGVGDLAIRFGYYRYQTDVMVITVILLIILVQIIHAVGEKASAKVEK